MSAPQPFLPRHRRLLLWLCVVVWVCALVTTHLPASRLPSVGSDVGAHYLGYLVLTTAFWLALKAHGLSRPRRVLWVVVTLVVYAVLDEITQPIFGRGASLADWLADAAGTLSTVATLELIAAVLGRGARPGRS